MLDNELNELIPEDNYDPLFSQTLPMDVWGLEELWKPKWYISLYYKVCHYIHTGEWPVRIWRCKDMLGPVSAEHYKTIYEDVSKWSRF